MADSLRQKLTINLWRSSIFKKSLLSAPKRLQRMMLRLQKFDLLVSYKKGTEMYLADTLSRAFRMCQRTRQDTREDVVCIEQVRSNTERELEFVNKITASIRSNANCHQTSNRIRCHPTRSENSNQRRLASLQLRGTANIRNYFPFREELSLQNELVFKGERLVIPASDKDELLAKIYVSHIGIQGSLRRAREVIY